jgi:hypothetical protein
MHLVRSISSLAITPRLCRAVAALAAAVALLRVALSIPVFTNTVDEPFHIAAGVALWDVGKHTLGVEHPPLPRLVAALPLYLSGVRLPADARDCTVRSEPETLARGTRILFESALSYEQVLDRARLAMLAFPAVALLYVYLLTRWVAGEVAAMLAVAFFSFDPTLLGHAMWVTTDAAACAGFLAATHHGLRWVERPAWRRALGAGLAIGLAVACKFSCALVIPGLIVVMTFKFLRRRRSRPASGELRSPANHRRAYARVLAQLAVVALVAFVALWATYLFDVGPMSDQTAFAPDSPFARIPQWVRDAPIPMPSLPLGVLRLLGHNRWGHPAYLNGEFYRYGRWTYFPEALALKSPLALLTAVALALLAVWRLRGPRSKRLVAVLAVGGVFFWSAMAGNLNIGVRHVLPAVALLYVLACGALVRARAAGLVAALVVVAALETAAAHPDYVAFFNRAAGGTARGEAFLIDSNLDWGQDLGRLARWLKSDEAAGHAYTMRLFAYPTDRIVAHLGLDPAALSRPPSGLFAISVDVRRGLVGARLRADRTIELTEDYAWLARYPHLKRIGSSIDVYDLAAPQLAGRDHN